MTEKEIIQILMSNPYYLELNPRERKEVFDYLCFSYGEASIGKRKVYKVRTLKSQEEAKRALKER